MTNFGLFLIAVGGLCLCIAFGCSFIYGLTYPWVIPAWVNRWWLGGFVSLGTGIVVAAWPLVAYLVCYFLDWIGGR